MSIWQTLTTAYSLEDAFRAKDITSQEMKAAITDWFSLYYDRMPTKDSDPCQRIAYTVVNKLTKTCFGEYQITTQDSFAESVLAALNASKRKAMQMLLVGGETFLKPFPARSGWGVSVVRRDNVLVFGRDANGSPTDIGTVERTTEGSRYYALLERRTVEPDGRLTIRNKLYSSDNSASIGQPVSLQALARYENLPDEYTYDAQMGLGLVHMQVPIENIVDGSPDGVSVYAAAAGLIHNIDHNEALINGEFDRGQSRIFVSDDLTRRDEKTGKRKITGNEFIGIDGNPEDIGVHIFSPALREQSYLNRKREYLRNVESVIGIKRGLLSEVEAQERTAKEVTSSEGDYNLTIIDLQEVWSAAIRDAMQLCATLGKLYRVPGAHDVPEDAVAIDYGNGVLYDEEKTWADYKDMVARGLIKPEIAMGWRFGMPTDTPADLQKIREKYMPELDGLMAGEE